MRIGFFELEPWEKEYIQSNEALAQLSAELVFIDHALDKHSIPDDPRFDIVSVFIGSVIDADVLDAIEGLRYVTTRSTGFDHIDLEACAERGVVASNVPNYGENTVAEFTMALILTLTRRIYDGYQQVRETGSFRLDNLRGFDLQGKTLGVVGTGRIGRHVIRMAKGFEMNVIAYDVMPDENVATELGFSYLPLEGVFQNADIVSLHVPYREETHHLINADTLSLMKESAYLINTSRGGIVDTEALVRALRDKRIAGAALDVMEEEGVIKDELHLLLEGHPEEHNLKTVMANHVLIDMPNVIVTPHNAFNTWEALRRILDVTVENITQFVADSPVHTVTKP